MNRELEQVLYSPKQPLGVPEVEVLLELPVSTIRNKWKAGKS